MGELQQYKWNQVSLGDLLTRITYGFTNPMPTTESGPYMVTAKDIRDGKIDYNTARTTSYEAYTSRLTAKSRPRVGDVLLTKDGSIGRVAVCDREDVCINQSVALLQPKEGVDSKFLGYLLQAPEYQTAMAADADGSTIKHIYITRVDKMSVRIPQLAGQQAITDVLGALDDKIAANERVLESVESVSAATWEGSSRGGAMVPLSSLAAFVNGRAYTKNASGTGRVVVRIAELNSGISGSTVYNDIEVPDNNLARPGDILFAWSGSLTVARWYRPEAIVNQHIFKVLPAAGCPPWLVNQALLQVLAEFRAVAADKATTMGHIQRRHLDEPVRIPSPDEVARIGDVMTSLWDLALAVEVENLELARTRDELLPLLMSGRVTVRDAERTVSNVV